ncbi:MAG: hypothetical protein WC789_07000 [Lentisphaeria bacterium]
MPFVLTSVDPVEVPEDGGRLITLTGTFELGATYRVHLGPLGTTADPECHSGVAGQGADCHPVNATTLRAYTPLLEPGSVVDVLVVDQVTAEQHALAAALTVAARQFWNSVWGIRQVLPSYYRMGARSIDQQA